MIHKLTSKDISEPLSKVDFTKDIVISCPATELHGNVDNEFVIRNTQHLKINCGVLEFMPNVKISHPKSIFIQYTTPIPGMQIQHIFKQENAVLFENTLINYSIGISTFQLNEFDRELFNLNSFYGMTIKSNSDIIKLNFLRTFQSAGDVDVYIIYNNLVFQQFPNLG